MNYNKTLLTILLVGILELFLLNVLKAPLISPLLVLFIVYAFTPYHTVISALMGTLCITLLPFTGLLFIPLVYLIPTACAAQYLRQRLLYPTTLFHYLFLFIDSLATQYVARGNYYETFNLTSSTMAFICGNLIILMIILKFWCKGRQDNRW